MTDDNDHGCRFIMIDNDRPWMTTDWLIDWLIDWLTTDKIMITTVSGLYGPTGLLLLICFWYQSANISYVYVYTCMFACMFFIQASVCICTHAYIYIWYFYFQYSFDIYLAISRIHRESWPSTFFKLKKPNKTVMVCTDEKLCPYR